MYGAWTGSHPRRKSDPTPAYDIYMDGSPTRRNGDRLVRRLYSRVRRSCRSTVRSPVRWAVCANKSVLSAVTVAACLCTIASTGARAEWLGGSKSNPSKVETWSEAGVASYYGNHHAGRRTASGAKFDKAAMTAAHAYLPFGTKVLVTVAGSDRAVVVTINDRLPTPTRVIDLSVGAARALGIIHRGVARVVLRTADDSEVGDHW